VIIGTTTGPKGGTGGDIEIGLEEWWKGTDGSSEGVDQPSQKVGMVTGGLGKR